MIVSVQVDVNDLHHCFIQFFSKLKHKIFNKSPIFIGKYLLLMQEAVLFSIEDFKDGKWMMHFANLIELVKMHKIKLHLILSIVSRLNLRCDPQTPFDI